MNAQSRSLIDQLGGLIGLPRVVVAALAGLVLTLMLVLAAHADTDAPSRGPWSLWKLGLEPAIIVYVLSIYPMLYRRWSLAIESLRPLSCHPQLLDEGLFIDRRGEWVAVLAGAAFGVWATGSQTVHGRWLMVYSVVANVLMFALMALAVRDGLVRAFRLRGIVRAGLQLDLFDRAALTPLARWGLSASLTFVGGTCLSLLFQSYETLRTPQSMVIYTVMTAVSLTLFFSSTWSIHGALVAAQARELAIVNQHWARARGELLRKLASGGGDSVAGLYEPIVVLGTYQAQVSAASTWPFNPKIVRDLVASLVAPFLLYGLKIAVGLPGGP